MTDDSNTQAMTNLVLHSDEAAFVKASETPATSAPPAESLLTELSDNIKGHLDQTMAGMKDQNKRDFEALLHVMKQESARRTSSEQRFHSQLLLQNECMVAMETKLLRLEAKVERRESAIRLQQQQQQSQQQRSHSSHGAAAYQLASSSSSNHRLPPTAFTTINESAEAVIPPSSMRSAIRNSTTDDDDDEEEIAPPNMAVVSSGASLASGVTAGSFLGEDGEDEETATLASDSGDPILREVESQQSTPTLGTRPRVAVGENGTLESILLNPMIGETNFRGLSSVRATRGEDTSNDGNSSLATSVTNSTYTSTVVTATTTRGDVGTVNVRRLLPDSVEQSEFEVSTPSRRGRSTFAEDIFNNSREEPRSRSQSPLTVNTHASETLSMASASTVGTSIRSSVAVAPRLPGLGRYNTRAMPTNLMGGSIIASSEARPLPDRVVSFTPELTNNMQAQPYSVEAADSITVPDELDTFSEVADSFANNARVWREEYEARLDALHKRWSNE